MSFTVQAFVSEPKLCKPASLKKSELVALVNHNKLEASSGMRMGDVRKLLSKFWLLRNGKYYTRLFSHRSIVTMCSVWLMKLLWLAIYV